MRIRVTIILLIVGMAMIVGGIFGYHGNPETNYEYDVKIEQVQSDSAAVNDTIKLSELDEARRDAVFTAWKKSDGALSDGTSTVETDEPLNISQENRWTVVEIDDVHVLVGIDGPEEVQEYSVLSFTLMLIAAIGFSLTLFGVTMLSTVVVGRYQ